MYRFSIVSAFCGCALLAAGCYKGQTTPTEKTDDGDNGKTVWKGTEPWKADYKTQEGDFAALKKLIKKHEGKVVIVDFWSNWCQPCVRELPHLAQLQKQYGDKVVCIAVNLNYDGTGDNPPNEARKKAALKEARKKADEKLRERFGKALGPNEKLSEAFISFISSQSDESFFSMAEIDAVPTIWVFSKSGKRTQITVDSVTKARPQKKRSGQTTADETEISYKLDVIPVVEKYLKE